MDERAFLRLLRERLAEILPEANIRWLARAGDLDAIAAVDWDHHHLRLGIEVVNQPNHARLRSRLDRIHALKPPDVLPIVAAVSLNSDLRRQCEEAGVGYVDLNGNILLHQGPVLIKKEVARGRYYHEARERSPFADRASLVIRHLLSSSDPQGVREIARAIGVSPGYASKVLKAAVNLDYAAKDSQDRFRLRNREELLRDWSSVYHWRRNECLPHYCALPHAEIDRILRREARREKQPSFALSLHGGNNRVEPFVDYDLWHVYAVREDAVQRLRQALDLRDVAPDAGNFAILRPYYRESVMHQARKIKDLWVVSDLQLYLDVNRLPVRGSEAADVILRRLRKQWPS